MARLLAIAVILGYATGCRGAAVGPAAGHPAAATAGAGEDVFGPLEVGADYARYRKLTDRPFQSLDHGNRWVDVYVNAIGADAYLSGAAIPIGTIVVKPSWQNDDGRASSVPGPVFVMEKRAAGYAPEHDDWYFAIHWAHPPAADAAKLGGPIYWRGKSRRAAYCCRLTIRWRRSVASRLSSRGTTRAW